MADVEKPPPPKEIPPKIRKEINGEPLVYFDHQLNGVRWFLRRRSGVLSDQPGLGKSIQSLSAAAVLHNLGKVERILVICSASMQDEWRTNHIEKMTHFSCQVLGGKDKHKRENELIRFIEEGTDILIIGYSQLVPHLDTLRTMPFQMVIIDEAHALKSPSAQRTKATHKLIDALEPRVYPLTATPMLNHEGDWWSLLKLVDRSTESWWQWKTKNLKMGGFKNKEVAGIKPNKKEQFRAKIDDNVLRRNVEDCIDLPELKFIRNNVKLSPAQGHLYIELQRRLREQVAEAMKAEGGLNGKVRAGNMSLAGRLAQLCSTAANVPINLDKDYEDDPWIYHPDSSVKLDKVVADVLEVSKLENKCVLGTRFLNTLDCMEKRLAEYGIPTFRIDGSVPQEDRHPLMEDWKLTKGAAVIMGSMPTISEGLTLTAAHDAFQVDPMFVPGHEWQFHKRIHRIGMDPLKEARIHTYVVRHTYEWKIEQIRRSKVDKFKDTVPNHGLSQREVFDLIYNSPDFEMNEDTIAY